MASQQKEKTPSLQCVPEGWSMVHDGIYRSKYVPADSADFLTSHRYKSTVG